MPGHVGGRAFLFARNRALRFVSLGSPLRASYAEWGIKDGICIEKGAEDYLDFPNQNQKRMTAFVDNKLK